MRFESCTRVTEGTPSHPSLEGRLGGLWMTGEDGWVGGLMLDVVLEVVKLAVGLEGAGKEGESVVEVV